MVDKNNQTLENVCWNKCRNLFSLHTFFSIANDSIMVFYWNMTNIFNWSRNNNRLIPNIIFISLHLTEFISNVTNCFKSYLNLNATLSINMHWRFSQRRTVILVNVFLYSASLKRSNVPLSVQTDFCKSIFFKI